MHKVLAQVKAHTGDHTKPLFCTQGKKHEHTNASVTTSAMRLYARGFQRPEVLFYRELIDKRITLSIIQNTGFV